MFGAQDESIVLWMGGKSWKVVDNRTVCLHPGLHKWQSNTSYTKATRKGSRWGQNPRLCSAWPAMHLRGLGWGDREPLSKLCRGSLSGWGAALPTTVRPHRVYPHQGERGSCLFLEARRAGVLMKVTFMPSLTIVHILEILRICSWLSEAVKGRKKLGTGRKWKKSF